jgi:hypothetical protein
MSSSQEVLPYSVSTGSGFCAFDKLQGAKNYATWKNNMRTVLMSLRQWVVVAGTVHPPTPVDVDNPTGRDQGEGCVGRSRHLSLYGNFLPGS